jgi:hypothetical protein
MATIMVEDASVRRDALGDATRWVAERILARLARLVHAIAIPPERVRLRVTNEIPSR